MMAAPSVARVGFDKSWSMLVNSETSNEKASDLCLAYCYIRISVSQGRRCSAENAAKSELQVWNEAADA